MKSFTIKVGGPAGLGIMTVGSMLSRILSRAGFNIFDYTEYPSLIRGGHNVMEVRFSKEPIFSQEQRVDLLIAFNKETVSLHLSEMKEGSAVLYDPKTCALESSDIKQGVSLFPISFSEIIAKTGAPKVMENNVALGAVMALFGFPLDYLYSVIEDTFSSKGEKIISENKQAAQAGFDEVKSKVFKLETFAKSGVTSDKSVRKTHAVLTGNEAIGLGAIAAGCQFYVAYPMTPSSSLLHFMAEHSVKQGFIVRHAEDEIGVINEALGASFAGVRSMVGTSGGGFALMNEAVSLAGITETPIVIMISQRPGPATGLPTWTEQGDLLYAIRSGHGEFPKIVLAPGDNQEAYELTLKAFNLADMYQTPVLILADKFLSESHSNTEIGKLGNWEIERGKIDQPKATDTIQAFPRYKATEDGISPRIFPGTKGYYFQANSYEHLEDGHTTEDSNERIKQVDKRNKKTATYLASHFSLPTIYGSTIADVTIIGWGSTKMVVCDLIQETGGTINNTTINYLHFSHVWPMDGGKVKEMLEKQKRTVLVENNSTGQLGQLIRQETGIEIKDKLLKYDGRPVYGEEIIDFIRQIR